MIIPGIFITWSVHLLKESSAIIAYRRYKTNSISQKHQRRPRTHFRLYVMTQFLPRWKVVSVGSGLTVYSGSWKNRSRVTKRHSDALTRMVFRLLPSNGKEINANLTSCWCFPVFLMIQGTTPSAEKDYNSIIRLMLMLDRNAADSSMLA